jgi:hypothetical protein
MPVVPVFAVDWLDYLPYLPIVVGCGVGLIVMTVFSLRRRRRVDTTPPPILLSPPARVADWEPEPESQSFANRRSSIRREGQPVKVLVSSPTLRNGGGGGYVLDRSTGGLRIALTAAQAPGSTLQVRAENAPDTVPWVTLIVRSCRNAGQHFELGCEFDRTPPWNVLLLFG